MAEVLALVDILRAVIDPRQYRWIRMAVVAPVASSHLAPNPEMPAKASAIAVVAVDIAVKGSGSDREAEDGWKSGCDLFGAPAYGQVLRNECLVLREEFPAGLVAPVSAAFRDVVRSMGLVVRPLVALDLAIDRRDVKTGDFGDLFSRMECALEFVDDVSVVNGEVVVCVVH